MIEPGIGHRGGRVRIEQAKRNYVKLLGAAGKEGTGIVVHYANVRRGVWLLRVVLAAQGNDRWIDLNGRHTLDGMAKRAGGVIASPCSDDERRSCLRMKEVRHVVLA